MKLVFSRGHNIASELICSITGEEASHFSIMLYEKSVPIILQSNFLGVDFQSYKMFSLKGTIVKTIDIPMDQQQEDDVFDNVVKTMVGEGYNFKALFYFGYRMLLFKFFGVAVPLKNPYTRNDQSICLQLAKALPIDPVIKAMDLAMVTPIQLYKLLNKGYVPSLGEQ